MLVEVLGKWGPVWSSKPLLGPDLGIVASNFFPCERKGVFHHQNGRIPERNYHGKGFQGLKLLLTIPRFGRSLVWQAV